MVFNTTASLLDAIVLAIVSKNPDDAYGYKITQSVRSVIEVSESTLYPVLRRLQNNDCLEIYDRQINGRNRRYYKITGKGDELLEMYEREWAEYAGKISNIFSGKKEEMKDE